jgi:single-stranded-DNA-specific exonuclease
MSENGAVPRKRWLCAPVEAERRDALSRAAELSPIVAGLLCARGIETAEDAHRFLNPDLDQLHDPLLLPDAGRAVERLTAAIGNRERILVHGDYDVDGVTAAALLTRVLRKLGADVECFVPHRMVDGYDIQPETVRSKATEGVKVIVTVDCGIVAFEAADCARALGVDLIVTDHHEPGAELPPAYAVVNPKRADSKYPFPYLSGVGVAFKLATALVRRMGAPEQSFRTNYLDLVALGTAADCMPLVDENRVFVKFGLALLPRTKKVGLQALLRSAGLAQSKLTARSLGFALGPRINAVGRLDAAAHALELLLTQDMAEARRLAEQLERCNQERQAVQNRIFEQAVEQARDMVAERQHLLVLASEGWHSGVIGIVASKLTEAFSRPTIMIALDGASGRGSARSVHDFNIFAAIDACRELLQRCGGHAAAAGFDISSERVDEFREMICRIAADRMDEEVLVPRVELDAYLSAEDLSLNLARELARLEPFGHGNPAPVFATRAMRVANVQALTSRQTPDVSHLKLRLHTNGSAPVDALYWRNGQIAGELCPATHLDVCYALEVNEFRGEQSLQLNIKDLRISQEAA